MLGQNKEHFNIFSVLHKSHDERRLHSRFISNLLGIESSHGKKDAFLNCFFDVVFANEVSCRQNFIDIKVYPTEWNKSENNNIDILIIDRQTKYAVIIENKIYAGDSNNVDGGQLERYFNHIVKDEKIPPENIRTFYLTLDGHEPSVESIGKYATLEALNGKCISYSIEIISWLERCLKLVYDAPFLRESLIQYKKLIEKMTNNDTEVQQRIELRDAIGRNHENMSSAKMLIDNFKHIKWHTVRDFWDELADSLVKNGFIVTQKPTDANVTDLTHYETYRKGQKNKQGVGIVFTNINGIEFCIMNDNQEGNTLYWGCKRNVAFSDNLISQAKSIPVLYPLCIESPNFLFWSNIFENEQDYITLSDFSRQPTFNLINAEKRKQTVEQIIGHITPIASVISN